MAGGKIRLLWDCDIPAVVNIYGAGGAASTAFTVAGSPVTFPYTLSANTTFATAKGDTYSVSVKLNGVEIADAPDAPGTVYVSVSVKIDGSQVTTGQKTVDGDGQDIQVVRPMAVDQTGGGTLSFIVATLVNDAEASPIPDGVATHDVYLKLTREAYGPVEIA